MSWETDWDGPTYFASERNLSSPLLPDPTNLSHTREGSLSAAVPENATGSLLLSPPTPRIRDPILAQAEVAILGLILALTVLGNSFVLWVLLRKRKHRAPMHLFMVNLCMADLVVAIFQVLPQLVWDITERFQGPDAMCRLVKYLQIVGMFASSYMIVAMTVDRYYAICCPLQAYRGGATSWWNPPIMVAWGLALVLSLPQVFIFSRSEMSPGEFECWGHFAESWGLKAYVSWMTVVVFLLPALIITVCQVRIFREIHNNIYLKSERVVSAELKKNSVLLHFHRVRRIKRERGRRAGGRGRVPRGGHLPKTTPSYLCRPHCHSPLHTVARMNSSDCGCPHSNGSANGSSSKEEAETCPSVLPSSEDLSSHPGTCPTVRPEPVDNLENHRPAPALGTDACLSSFAYNHPCNSSSGCLCAPSPYAPLTHSVSPSIPGVSKAMSKTVRMTLVIVLVYTVCWSPFFIVQLWAAWDPNSPNQGVAFTILMLLASLNSCTNPWIYTAFSSSVSHELQALLCCKPHSTRCTSFPDDSSTTHTSTTAKDTLY
ncbi:vasopressin V2 receptor-like [Scleropages formosus]|uniref:Arginine vasopressin receptor 2 n=1 Tax=Scleropages formosus TaxID=113540 RepID=A0A0P7UXY0_SCLFO|nr:vasopressin V2 receptor-like [Scleropages formosus]KPP75026.1 vasopressin V2 receptor-like [Scleropages formosus]